MKEYFCVKVLVLLFALLLIFTESKAFYDADDFEDHRYLADATRQSILHQSVIPLNYTISLRPWNFENDILPEEMAGMLIARVRAVRTDTIIEVNQDKLDIKERDVEVMNVATGESLLISNFTLDNRRQLFRIQMEEEFKEGDVLLVCIPFGVKLLTPIKTADGLFLRPGISLVNFTDPENSNITRQIFVTRLQPRRARRVFPLVDDPNIRTPFKIIVARDRKWTKGHSISNMEIDYTEENTPTSAGGWVEDHFQETPPIAPHQLFILLSDYLIPSQTENSKARDKHVVTLWSTNAEMITSNLPIADAAEKLTTFYGEKFKMKYPLGKLDILLVPHFGKFLNQETLGVITVPMSELREDTTHPQGRVLRIVKILAEKIAEQWFGIIASSYQTNSYFSEYTSLARAIPGYLQVWGLSHLNVSISPGEIIGLASQSTVERYLASLIWMLDDFLGLSIIENALSTNYLPKGNWSVTTFEDLYEAIDNSIEAQQGEFLVLPNKLPPIKEVMHAWTETEKYDFPLLRVRMGESDEVIMEQERFDSSCDPEIPAKPSGMWIPVTVLHNHLSQRFLFSPNDTQLKYSPQDSDSITTDAKLFLANPNGAGYYRTHYCPTLTTHILNQLNSDHTRITTSGRIQLIDDFVTLSLKNYSSIERAFESTKYLVTETNPGVWRSVLEKLAENVYDPIRENNEVYGNLRQYFVTRLEPLLESLGGVRNIYKDPFIVKWCLRLEVLGCVQYANELMDRWMDEPDKNQVQVFPTIVSAYVWQCGAMSNETKFAFILSKHKNTTERSIKDEYLYVLTCTKNITLLTTLLENEQDEYSLDRLLQFLQHRRRPELREVMYEFGKRNVVSQKISPEIFRRIVSFMEGYTSHPSGFVDELRQFIQSNQDYLSPVMSRLESHLKTISACKRCLFWTQTGNKIATWLSNVTD